MIPIFPSTSLAASIYSDPERMWLDMTTRDLIDVETEIKQFKLKEDLPFSADKFKLLNDLRVQYNKKWNCLFSLWTKELSSHGIDPTKMPREFALQFAKLITEFGILNYRTAQFDQTLPSSEADEEKQKSVKLTQPLAVLQFSHLMYQYALGISDQLPPLSLLENLNDAFLNLNFNKMVQEQFTQDRQLENSGVWAERANNLLLPHQLIDLARSLHGLHECLCNFNKSPLTNRESLEIERNLFYIFKKLSPVLKKDFYVREITTHPAFKNITGGAAASLLDGRDPKTYLIRPSSIQGCYVFEYKKHMGTERQLLTVSDEGISKSATAGSVNAAPGNVVPSEAADISLSSLILTLERINTGFMGLKGHFKPC